MQKTKQTNIYPGVYTATYTEDYISNEISKIKSELKYVADIYITKSDDGWMIRLPFPGKNKENFYIRTENNLLSIYLIHEIWEKSIAESHESLKIELPEMADKAFISATLKNGMLNVFVPICEQPIQHDNCNILVY